MVAINRKITLVNFNDRNTNPKYIVIHYVGAVSTAKNNANYFYNAYRGASAHYFVDENEIWQVVEDNDTAWAVGGSKYNNAGGSKYGIIKNSNSLSIEMCVKKDANGNWYYEQATLDNTAALVQQKMAQYGIPASNVYRHYDVTGKPCPANYLDDASWAILKAKLTTGAGSGQITISGGSGVDTSGTAVSTYRVRVTSSNGLNCRTKPSTNGSKITAYANGTILTITKESGNWGYANNTGWVCLTYTARVTSSGSSNSIIAAGQQHSINFTGRSIAVDGIYGTNTKKNGIRCVQNACNLDYGSGLAVDGAYGTKTKTALGSHYVKKGETQYLVTAVEILLMLRGYDPQGVECPGIFGSGLQAAVKQYQSDAGLKVDGIAGKNTIKSLMNV